MKSDLVLLEINTSIKEASKVLGKINSLSRLSTASKSPFKVLDGKKFDFIVERSKEINEKIYHFSRKNSLTQRRLMTLSMLYPANATYRVLRQILSSIERKQQAIITNVNKLKETQIELTRLKLKQENASMEEDKVEYSIQIEEKVISVANTMSYLEAAIKEVGGLLESYEQIKKNKNIGDDWTEEEFEQAEIKANVMGAFRNAVRDYLVNGRLGMGTLEYLEQFGISPFEAIHEVGSFINRANLLMKNGSIPDYNAFYSFLEEMGEKYKENYKKTAAMLGLDSDKVNKSMFLFTLPGGENEEEI